MFDLYLARWDVIPDGDPIVTLSSRLLPVRYRGTAAKLKIAAEQEEQRGGAVMVWWDGAARAGS
jgi:streptomycin 6-kinase